MLAYGVMALNCSNLNSGKKQHHGDGEEKENENGQALGEASKGVRRHQGNSSSEL